jgi:hypothetical protein
MDEDIILPSFKPGSSEPFHSSLFMWWQENFRRDFQFALARNMLTHAGQELQIQIPMAGETTATMADWTSGAFSIGLFRLMWFNARSFGWRCNMGNKIEMP